MLRQISILLTLFVCLNLYAQGKGGIQPTSGADEMALYREIAGRKIATRQDLYDLLAMQSGEFDRHPTAEARNAALQEKGVTIKEGRSEPVTRGEVAKALLQAYDFEKGLFYTITKWEFYALRDIQQAGIIQGKFTAHQRLSGRQLIGIINLAADKAEEITNYQAKK